MERRIACIGCGAAVPDVDGPTHRYIGASPGCWAVYSELLARQYADFRVARVHRFAVDAYAVQHPGEPERRQRQSVQLHLAAQCLMLERGWSDEAATRAMQQLLQGKPAFAWLEPPGDRGATTVVDVMAAEDTDELVARIRGWAEVAWEAWHAHHATVRRLVDRLPSAT